MLKKQLFCIEQRYVQPNAGRRFQRVSHGPMGKQRQSVVSELIDGSSEGYRQEQYKAALPGCLAEQPSMCSGCFVLKWHQHAGRPPANKKTFLKFS